MTLKRKLGALQATVLTLAIALPSVAAQPVFAKPGGIKPAFTAAAKGTKRPLPKTTIQPHGKPKMNPGLPKARPKPTTAGGGKKPGHLSKQFNKQAGRKPLREIFNPAARPPSKPVKGDPPPAPVHRPKGPTF